MIRLARTMVLLGILAGSLGGAAEAQQTPVARCLQLADHADRYLRRSGEGGSGPNMMVLSARLDCQKGKPEKGIADLEKLLRDQRINVPPPPG